MIRLAGNFFKVPNVETPYEGDLPSTLTNGTKVFVRLTPNDDCEKIEINLMAANGDTILHFNPRPSQGVTVANSCLGGDWGDEQRVEANPFEPGTSYGIEINVEQEKYCIIISGNFNNSWLRVFYETWE